MATKLRLEPTSTFSKTEKSEELEESHDSSKTSQSDSDDGARIHPVKDGVYSVTEQATYHDIQNDASPCDHDSLLLGQFDRLDTKRVPTGWTVGDRGETGWHSQHPVA